MDWANDLTPCERSPPPALMQTLIAHCILKSNKLK